ncbi:hypothetical protein [Streptomyces hirsutus]|uniref:hypothetical protein n=1 Tax=Streptomyces hirsutus TaxID=35620 RepID=UPI003662B99D
MPTISQDGLPDLRLPRGGPTITEQFHAFDSQHSWVYRALKQLVEHNYTALYARRLLAAHPEWASAIHRGPPSAQPVNGSTQPSSTPEH